MQKPCFFFQYVTSVRARGSSLVFRGCVRSPSRLLFHLCVAGMSLLSLDVALSAVSGLVEHTRPVDVGWRARLQMLFGNRSGAEIARMLRQDLLGQAMNPLFHTWGLSRQPFRIAADGAAYPLVEFLTWRDGSAEEMWNRARAASRWETHRALLSRLRAALQAKSQRLAVLSLRKSSGLPPVAVCAVAAFLWKDANGIVRHFAPKAKKRLVNRPAKDKDGDQPKRAEKMVEAKQLPPKALLVEKVSRIANKKIPWPRRRLGVLHRSNEGETRADHEPKAAVPAEAQ